MTAPLSAAVTLLAKGQYEAAARALEPLVGATRTGVIARFRRAEALSRLGRHDEACEAARAAAGDAGATPAAPLWLAWTLGEAGRFADAAAVELPATTVEPLEPLRAGFAALARIHADDREQAAQDVETILDTRHAPIYSLALRLCERWRLARTRRWPDVPSAWYSIECGLEMEHDGLTEHPATPEAGRGGESARRASRWVRMHCGCGDYTDLVKGIRSASPVPADVDEAEFEMLLALGRLDAAERLANRLTTEAGDDAAGELAICRARLGQLQGRPETVDEFPGARDARTRMAQMSAWLDLGAALLRDDDDSARSAADAVADPSRREYVEAALRRWAGG